MTHSTTRDKQSGLRRAAAAAFWLLLWQAASFWIGQEILLVSPVSVLRTLLSLCVQGEFWVSIASSFLKIMAGFLLAMASGGLCAVLAYRSDWLRALFSIPVTVIKATPVASFVILALVWIRSAYLSVFIAFLMAFPIVYQNIYEGLCAADPKLLEMAAVFRVGLRRRALYVYMPSVLPFFVSAASLSAGLCWKSGIAAEVIGLPARSIGGALYEAKIFLDTGGMFAWTAVVIAVSLVLEKAVLRLIQRFQALVERK